MKRRDAIKLLASLPLVGRLVPRPDVSKPVAPILPRKNGKNTVVTLHYSNGDVETYVNGKLVDADGYAEMS